MIGILFLYTKKVNAQLSPADSLLMNGVFAENLFANPAFYPGNWYVYNEVNDVNDMYSKIDSIFPFTKYDFEDAYNRIQVASDFLYDTVRNNTFNYYYQFNNSAYYQYNH
ncbi:MAG: hypothetical protein IPO02_16425 [Bacteroidetes bacterium]|nr:hypothetical protein [Bacteroidota bacterium]